jgi:Cu(I)/Ag(I) efflux system membrane fusion protein
MKFKWLALVTIVVLLAAGAWVALKPKASLPEKAERKVLYYQSPMHPWIKSEQPGNCTICGMKLMPVFEGEKGFAADGNAVTLSSNVVNVIHVQTEEVRIRPLSRILRVAGTLEDNDSRHRIVSAYVDGRIESLHVNFIGAEVREGEPLATLYSPMLLTAQREFLTLRRQFARTNGPALQLDQTNLLAAAAQRLIQLGMTRAQVEELGDAPEPAIETELLAPVSGTVVARSVYAGQYVKEGDPMFEIADFSTMWFLFDVYERDLSWIRIGQPVEITLSSLPGKTLRAPIAFIDPNLNEQTRSARVRVELPNPLIEAGGGFRRELFHRTYAEGRVHVDVAEVLTVPREAVLAPGSQAFAYVENGSGAYEQRRITVGRRGDEHWEVLDGLAAGERVVTVGNLLIDAQSQLNQSASGGTHEHAAHSPAPAQAEPPTAASANAPADLPRLSESQLETIQAVTEAATRLSAALAADDLQAFNSATHALHPLAGKLSGAFAGATAWTASIEPVATSMHLAEADALQAARKAFFPFSMAVADLAQRLRARGEISETRIFKCPMTNQAFPGAPRVGFWIQGTGPLRNPFFGAEMLDCGQEVRP